MYSHVVVGSNDLDRSKQFYDALFVALGGRAGRFDEERRLVYINNDGIFVVLAPINGQPATPGNGITVGFAAETPQLVDAWHEAGCRGGGSAIEDPPGIRSMGGLKLYLAYLRDPDGNKLCAFHRLGDDRTQSSRGNLQ